MGRSPVCRANSESGFHATTAKEYAEGFRKALTMSPRDTLEMRQRARRSAQRFTDRSFADKWLVNIEKLVALQIDRAKKQ
jgi:alpha-1,2-mannosyltransferase